MRLSAGVRAGEGESELPEAPHLEGAAAPEGDWGTACVGAIGQSDRRAVGGFDPGDAAETVARDPQGRAGHVDLERHPGVPLREDPHEDTVDQAPLAPPRLVAVHRAGRPVVP
ncbi:MAG: hypothetical protein K6U08_04850, partial [Firmicutes bacterium]|nr:hypothetical protein [Bacillota bacterium]